MSLRNILRYFSRAASSDLAQAMTVEARPGALVHKDFREFTAPARRQRGASLQLTARRDTTLARIGIIPEMGGNIP